MLIFIFKFFTWFSHAIGLVKSGRQFVYKIVQSFPLSDQSDKNDHLNVQNTETY